MGGRNHDAPDRSTVTGMSVRIEDYIGHAWSHTRVDGLLEAGFIEVVTDRIGSDHGDRFPGIARERQEAEGFVGFMDGVHGFKLKI